MFSKLKALPIAAFAALTITTTQSVEPVKLVVGCQPDDTSSCSAAVIRALDLWK